MIGLQPFFSGRRLRKYPLILILALSVFSLHGADNADVLKLGTNYDPQTLDPGQAWDDVSIFYTENIFDTLVRMDLRDHRILPSLAESWEMKNSGQTWVFHLRRGIHFHDGSPLNAESVVFSFRRQMNSCHPHHYYHFPLFSEIFESLRKVHDLDDYTVEFQLERPFLPFLSALTTPSAAIVSPRAVMYWKKDFSRHPVGTGPFVFKSWEKGQRVVLRANENYWRGKVPFSEFVSVIDSKYEKLHQLFRTGRIDILMSISISRLLGLERLSWVTIKRIPTQSLSFISFNADRPLLRQRMLRQALHHSWDPRIIKYVFQDNMLPLRYLSPAGMLSPLPELTEFSGDLDSVREWVRTANKGKPVRLQLLMSSHFDLDLQMIHLYVSNLRRIGLEVDITSLDNQAYLQNVADGDYDLALANWIADYPDPHSIFSALFSMELIGDGFANLARWKTPEIEQLLLSASTEVGLQRRMSAYRALVEKVNQEYLAIPLYQSTSIVVFNNRRIKDVPVNTMGVIHLFEMERQ